jgi:hypothetical protein
VQAHLRDDTTAELAYRLFAVIDRMYAGPALAHGEHHVEDPAGLVARVVHAVDDAPWGPLLRADLRERFMSLTGAPEVPEDWLDHWPD